MAGRASCAGGPGPTVSTLVSGRGPGATRHVERGGGAHARLRRGAALTPVNPPPTGAATLHRPDAGAAMDRRLGLAATAIALHLAWTAATWWFEGRIGTFLRPDATRDRMVYALAVNLALGVGGGVALLRSWQRRGLLSGAAAGFGAPQRAAAAVPAGFALGLAAYLLQGAPSTEPAVVANAFAQVFVVSAAEVVVCWAVLGAATRSCLAGLGPRVGAALAAVAASVAFGLYHLAHSAPFDTLPMVALLTVVGLATSAFYFVSRDVAGTVVFHTFLGTFGVVQALAAAGSLQPLRTPQAPLLLTAAACAAALWLGYRMLRPQRRRDA
jgi:hypothetical protein